MTFSTLPDLPSFLNGDYSTLQHTKISVMDRGFIFGDGIYEVVPAYGGKPFRLEQHLNRLERSLTETRIPNPYSREAWKEIATQLIAKLSINTISTSQNSYETALNQLVYFQITRGVAMRDHVMTQGITPTVFAFVQPMKAITSEQKENGVACVSADDFRWKKAHIKTTSLLAAVFARQISADQGALETIMFRDGLLSEASASNVWVVKGGKVFGPKLDQLVLEGIRYGLVEELCAARGIPFELRNITREEVLTADELLLSSATKEVLAVTQLDGKPVGHGAGSGQPGPVFKQLSAGYQAAIAAL
ncbi:MAG: D-amino acid aminotransferase [Burkholderiaceae bacterium]